MLLRGRKQREIGQTSGQCTGVIQMRRLVASPAVPHDDICPVQQIVTPFAEV